ncbi:MAG TPA: NUDIX domain-containing protein [Rhabdochlamydiaceae bacterium]|jgi:8-oxo-dGTP pyrophosphatase MutT (NUDIX family)
MQSNSKQAIFGVVFNEERTEVLLIKRRDIPVWVFPGGGLESGENPEEGVRREVLEETGLDVRIVRKIAEYLPVNWMTQFTHVYECRPLSGKAKTGKEAKEVRFFPINALPLLPPPYDRWIQEAIANYPAMIRKEIEGVTMWILFKLLIQHPILVGRYLLTKIGIHIND